MQDPPVALDCLDLIGVREGADPIPLGIQAARLHQIAHHFLHPLPLGGGLEADPYLSLSLADTLEADDAVRGSNASTPSVQQVMVGHFHPAFVNVAATKRSSPCC